MMTRISLELTDDKPLTALYHPDINTVSLYSKTDEKHFSISLNMEDYISILGDTEKINEDIVKVIIRMGGI